MKVNSIWFENVQKKIFPKIEKNDFCDVLIVGGGISGISCAYQLMSSNKKVILIERNELGNGVTSKSTAKITYLQEDIYSKLLKYHGKEKSKLYLESQIEGMNKLISIIKKEKIDCDLTKNSSYLCSSEDNLDRLEKERDVLHEFKVKTSMIDKNKNFDNNYYFSVSDTYIFNPIKYVYSLAEIIKKNITIYEYSKLKKIIKIENGYYCKVNNYYIETKNIIIASHYPYFFIPFMFPLKVRKEKSYIKVYQVENVKKINAISINKPTYSIRFYQEGDNYYQIVLGKSVDICFKDNAFLNYTDLNKKEKKAKYSYSNSDIRTNDYLPFIGKIKRNMFIITGFNTWGMINATIGSEIIKDLIIEKENKYVDLFDPLRKINIMKIMNFPIILYENSFAFIKSHLYRNKRWYKNNFYFTKENNELIANYVDKNNVKHSVHPICPHLKCFLTFNEIELTYDCPCHGSRFDIDGKCILGPSNYDISIKNND